MNKTRKVNWANRNIVKQWTEECDKLVISNKDWRVKICSPYWVYISLGEKVRMDLDNSIKAAIDYLVRIEVVEDDGPRHLQKLTVVRGSNVAPEGMVITVGEIE